jgi:PAS domain S-box-containing protein
VINARKPQSRSKTPSSADGSAKDPGALSSRIRLPFSVVLMVPFALIITAAVGITGYLGYRRGFAAVSDLAGKLHGEAAKMTHQHLDRYLAVPHLVNRLNMDAIRIGELDPENSSLLAGHFAIQIERFDAVMSIAYGSEQAEYVGFNRGEPGGDLTLGISGKATNFVLTGYRADADGNRLEKTRESEPGFDPRPRPWYKAAVKAGGPTWAPIFMRSGGDVGLDAVVPVVNESGLKGVLDVSLTLTGIGAFLRQIDVLDHGQTFIMERDGSLIAASSIAQPYTQEDGGFALMNAAECGEPVIRAAAVFLGTLPGGISGIREAMQFRFGSSTERFFAQAAPYSDALGLDWLIVTAIPESDFMSGIYKHIYTMEWLVVVSLFASILFAALVARWVTRPIYRLNKSIQGVALGAWAGKVDINRRDEIGDLARSFDAMNDRLQAAFSSLTESEEKFHVLSEQSHIGVCIVQDGRVRYMNRTFGEVTGWGEMADMKAGFPNLSMPVPESTLIAEMERLSRQPEDFRQTVQAPDLRVQTQSGERWYSVFLKTVHLRGKPAGMAAFVDITEEKAEREKARDRQKLLIQAEKLASLGVLVAGVAHEINSPNQAILLSSQVVKDAWPQLMEILEEYRREHGDFLVGGAWFSQMSEMIPNCLDAIGKCSDRIAAIVTDLKDYARQDPTESFRAVDLNLVVTSALALTSAMLKKSTRNLVVDLASDLPPVHGSFQRLEQVIVNLIQNACQALTGPSHGIRVSSRFIREADRIELTVTDEGKGIAVEDMPKILDPFFTTKRESGGMGLGLAVSNTIVEQHGGSMEFHSVPGAGTTVVVLLPALTA